MYHPIRVQKRETAHGVQDKLLGDPLGELRSFRYLVPRYGRQLLEERLSRRAHDVEDKAVMTTVWSVVVECVERDGDVRVIAGSVFGEMVENAELKVRG